MIRIHMIDQWMENYSDRSDTVTNTQIDKWIASVKPKIISVVPIVANGKYTLCITYEDNN